MRPAPSGAVLLFRVAFSSVVVFGRAQPMRGRASGQWSVHPWPAQISARAFFSAIAFYLASHAIPRVTVLRDTALQVENCKEVKDGRGRWDGRGPVGARPPRWRRRVHARAPTADVGAPQAGRGAPSV